MYIYIYTVRIYIYIHMYFNQQMVNWWFGFLGCSYSRDLLLPKPATKKNYPLDAITVGSKAAASQPWSFMGFLAQGIGMFGFRTR